MIQFIIPIVRSFLPIWNNYLIYIFALAFLAFVGAFIHGLIRR